MPKQVRGYCLGIVVLLPVLLALFPVLLTAVRAADAVEIPAAASTPAGGEQRNPAFARAREAYRSGRYPEALKALRQAFLVDPANVDLNFLMGMAALRSGDYETAASAFDRVLAMRPELDRVKLELARSYYHLRLYAMAERLFNEVLAGEEVPPGVKRSVRAVLGRIAREKREHVFSGALVLSVSRDSNARISPGGGVDLPGLPTLTVPVERDWFFAQTLILEHAYRPHGKSLSWFTSLMNYNAFYVDQDELDVNYYRLATGPRWQRGDWSAGLDLVGGYMEEDYDRYLGSYGGDVWVARQLSAHAALRLECFFEERNYYQESTRDAFFGQIRLRPIFTFGALTTELLLGYEFDNADADWEAYDRLLAEAHVRYRLPLRLTAIAGYEYEYSLYDATDPLTGTRRRDDLHQIYVGLRRDLGAHAAVELVHKYEKCFSNSDVYDYDRNLSTLSFTYAF